MAKINLIEKQIEATLFTAHHDSSSFIKVWFWTAKGLISLFLHRVLL